MRILRFGKASKVYTFPELQDEYHDNFIDLLPVTSRIAGVSGGFDELGDDPAPAEKGNIQFGFTLVCESRHLMEAKLDALKQLRAWPKMPLYAQPSDPALPERFCYARLNNIYISRRHDEHTDLFQKVKMSFQVSDPRWYVQSSNVAVWGSFVWGSGKKWGTIQTPVVVSGLTTSATVTQPGTATVQPKIILYTAAGQTISNPTIQRIVNNAGVDQVSWLGTLNQYETLEINAGKLAVYRNGNDAYTSAFDYLHPDWFRLEGGANSIKVLLGNSGDAGKVVFSFNEAYY